MTLDFNGRSLPQSQYKPRHLDSDRYTDRTHLYNNGKGIIIRPKLYDYTSSPDKEGILG